MNAITLINVALHVLLLSALGWGMVRWCIPDARHRAWASLLVLLIALVAPLFMEIRGEVAVSATEETPAAPATSWKPDWKISTTVTAPVSSFSETVTEPPAAPVWTPADVAWWTCVLWIGGTAVVTLLLSVLSFAAWRWRRSLRSPTVTEMDLLPSSASRYALRVSEREGCPCVVGLWQPVIAVPHRIIGKWSPRQWTWLLRHEGEHVRNRDTLTAWLLGWTKALVWWNPFVHALVEQWSQAREEICDVAAVSGEDDRTAYSGFLLDIAAGHRAPSPLLLHMAASRPARRLRARMVAMLAQRRVRERASRAFQFGALLIMASIAAIVSCVGLKAEDAPAKGFPKIDDTPTKESTEMYTRTFKVAPDFLTSGKPAPHAEPDPFSGGKAPVARRMTAMDILKQRGIAFPEGASASFVPATSQLIVKNTQANIARIELELGTIKDEQEFRNNTQVYVSTKWVELDAAQVHGGVGGQGAGNTLASLMEASPDILTDPQFRVVIRALAQTKGVNLMTAPSVTTRSGQRATVEVIREFYSKEAVEAAAKGLTEPGPDFIGPRNEILVEVEGDRYSLKLQIRADLGELDKKDPANPRVLHLRKSRTANIFDGDTLYMEMGESPTNKGRLVLLFVTAKLIGPPRQPVGADEAMQRAQRAELLKKEAASAASPLSEVKFDIGRKQFAPGDDIVIEKVSCSSPNFALGDRVVVKGHYKLASAADARLSLHLTSIKDDGKWPVSPQQTVTVQRGAGAFELSHTIRAEGTLHVSFYPTKGGSDLGGVYFGTQEQAKLSTTFTHKTDQIGGSAASRTPGRPEPSVIVKEAASNGVTPQGVKFVVGQKQFAEGDEIVIDKVLCSSGEFKPGDRVVVQGHYKLASIPEARLALSLSSFANGGRGRWQPEQYGDVQRGSGAFERAEDIQFDGSLHVSFYDMKAGKSIGGVYFGTQEQMNIGAAHSRPPSSVVVPVAESRTTTKTPEVTEEPEDTRPVDVTVWLAEFRHGKDEDLLKVLSAAIPPLPKAPKEEVVIPSNVANDQWVLPPGLYGVSAVVTPSQMESLKGALINRVEMKTNALPVMTTTSGKTATFNPEAGLQVEALPAVGPDGFTVDLNVAIKSGNRTGAKMGKIGGGVTTSITLWDGQTVIMGGTISEDEKSRLSRLIFITPKMKK